MKTFRLLMILLLFPLDALAGVCDAAWDGDKLIESTRGSSLSRSIRLRNKDTVSAEVTVGQVQAFYDAKERISKIVALSPSFIICDSRDVNAFAGSAGNGQVVGVTVGMLKLADGNPDMAAAVIGHEYAHHVKGHRAATQTREAIAGLLALIVGAALENKVQQRYGVTGLGMNLGQIGATLVSSKFSRDQEREADRFGFEYMLRAGFNPNGAVQLANRMNQIGLGGIGLFLDSHPGWPERESDFRTMIASSPDAQRLASAGQPIAPLSRREPAQSSGPLALAATYITTDAQKSFVAGAAAYRNGDIVNAAREFRSAAEAGYAPAQVGVGYLYSEGKGGLPKDDVEAVRYFKLAAAQGHARGQVALGLAYILGRGLRNDDAEAVRYFKLAAAQGHAGGQVALGLAYASGRGGLSQDEAEAARYYKLSADQGDAEGQVNLAAMYESGRSGLPPNEAEAVRYYQMAAKQGNATAITRLKIKNIAF